MRPPLAKAGVRVLVAHRRPGVTRMQDGSPRKGQRSRFYEAMYPGQPVPVRVDRWGASAHTWVIRPFQGQEERGTHALPGFAPGVTHSACCTTQHAHGQICIFG
jgi:hypothetical protein